MVNFITLLSATVPSALPDGDKQTVLERLDPERRVAVIMALVALGLLGALFVVLAMLAGRWARQRPTVRGSRLGEPSTGRQATPSPSEPTTDTSQPNRGETLVNRPGDNETKT